MSTWGLATSWKFHHPPTMNCLTLAALHISYFVPCRGLLMTSQVSDLTWKWITCNQVQLGWGGIRKNSFQLSIANGSGTVAKKTFGGGAPTPPPQSARVKLTSTLRILPANSDLPLVQPMVAARSVSALSIHWTHSRKKAFFPDSRSSSFWNCKWKCCKGGILIILERKASNIVNHFSEWTLLFTFWDAK